MAIAIVIPVYNGEKYLSDLFRSLENQSYKDFQIIAIDNASSDNSKEFIKENYPQAKLIENPSNFGFAKACNQGIKKALEDRSEFIFLLNQDMVLEKNCLEELVKEIRKNEKIAALQPILLFWNDKNRINSTGNVIQFLGFGYSKDFGLRVQGQELKKEQISYPSGGAGFWRSDVLKELGGFDENLFYTEDVDLGWRAHLLGYKIFNCPKAIVYHQYVFLKSKEKYYHLEKGRLITILKNYSLKTFILIFPALFLMEMAIVFYSLFKSFFREKVRAYQDFLKQIKKTLEKRKKIQKERKINDKEIFRIFSGYFESDYEDYKNPILRFLINPLLNLYFSLIKLI